MMKNIFNDFMVFSLVMAIVLFAGGEAFVARSSQIGDPPMPGTWGLGYPASLGGSLGGQGSDTLGGPSGFLSVFSPLDRQGIRIALYGDYPLTSGVSPHSVGLYVPPLSLIFGREDSSRFSSFSQESYLGIYGPGIVQTQSYSWDSSNRMSLTSYPMPVDQMMHSYAADITTSFYPVNLSLPFDTPPYSTLQSEPHSIPNIPPGALVGYSAAPIEGSHFGGLFGDGEMYGLPSSSWVTTEFTSHINYLPVMCWDCVEF